MTKTTITALENGDVRVQQEFFDGDGMAVRDRTFTVIGHYVHQVFPNGATQQVCEGLRLRGPTLMAGDDLGATIRAAIATEAATTTSDPRETPSHGRS